MAGRKNPEQKRKAVRPWTFLTNHSHVLVCMESDPEVRMRDIALRIGITERAVQRIAADLENDGYINVIRRGRQNFYRVQKSRRLRHPIEGHCSISNLLALLTDDSS